MSAKREGEYLSISGSATGGRELLYMVGDLLASEYLSRYDTFDTDSFGAFISEVANRTLNSVDQRGGFED